MLNLIILFIVILSCHCFRNENTIQEDINQFHSDSILSTFQRNKQNKIRPILMDYLYSKHLKNKVEHSQFKLKSKSNERNKISSSFSFPTGRVGVTGGIRKRVIPPSRLQRESRKLLSHSKSISLPFKNNHPHSNRNTLNHKPNTVQTLQKVKKIPWILMGRLATVLSISLGFCTYVIQMPKSESDNKSSE